MVLSNAKKQNILKHVESSLSSEVVCQSVYVRLSYDDKCDLCRVCPERGLMLSSPVPGGSPGGSWREI